MLYKMKLQEAVQNATRRCCRCAVKENGDVKSRFTYVSLDKDFLRLGITSHENTINSNFKMFVHCFINDKRHTILHISCFFGEKSSRQIQAVFVFLISRCEA
jgi:hypothetical protein